MSGAQLAAEVNEATSLTAALAYARLGWPVLPVAGMVGGTCGCRARGRCTHPAKHPLIKDGTASATVDAQQLHEWWTYWPWAGIGIVTGARSRLVVVDIDPRHDGNKTLGDLASRNELSTVTLTAHTGSGGIHLCYRLPDRRKAGNTSGRLPGLGDTPGVDVRGDGGYIVAAPSNHHSGNRYQWDPHSPTLAPAPPCTLRSQQRPPPRPRPEVQAGRRGGADYVPGRWTEKWPGSQGLPKGYATTRSTEPRSRLAPWSAPAGWHETGPRRRWLPPPKQSASPPSRPHARSVPVSTPARSVPARLQLNLEVTQPTRAADQSCLTFLASIHSTHR